MKVRGRLAYMAGHVVGWLEGAWQGHDIEAERGPRGKLCCVRGVAAGWRCINEAGANQMRRRGCQEEARVGGGGRAYYDDSYAENGG